MQLLRKYISVGRRRSNLLAGPLTIAAIYCVALALAAPFSSSIYSEYVYNYEANIVSGPAGLRFKAKAHLELIYANNAPGEAGGQLVRLRLTEPLFLSGAEPAGVPLSLGANKQLHDPSHHLYAHIVTLANGTAYIKSLYTHQADTTTFKNIKRSILLNLLPTNHHLSPIGLQEIGEESGRCPLALDNNNSQQPELFSPDSISQVKILAKPLQASKLATSTFSESSQQANELAPSGFRPQVFELVEGHQNVTFGSRLFAEAQSNLTTSFKLSLVDELKSDQHERFDSAGSPSGALKMLVREDGQYQADSIQLERERRVKSTHHSGYNLMQLLQLYKDSLGDESLASVEAAVAYLRLLDRLRDSQGTGLTEIMELMKKTKHQPDVQAFLLDILAAARTKDSITAALKHIKLARNNDLDMAERFLSVLSVAAKTAAKMQTRRQLSSPHYFDQMPAPKRSRLAKEQLAPLASIEYIAGELLASLKKTPANRWASQKLRWSTLLTLATLVNANNQEHRLQAGAKSTLELNEKVSELLLSELVECRESETDCRIVALQAIGNAGILGPQQYKALRGHVLGHSGRRESIAAMRVLRDLLQHQSKDKPFEQSFYTELKELLLRIIYDDKLETTSRVLAAEMIVRFLPNSLASEELLRHLPSFGNNELATMIYSRMQSLKPDSLAKHNDNWYWKSCIINGTSTSFVRTMAKTESLNASYGVNVELLNKGKILKESSFDVFLDTKERTQDLFSLGVFARGLSSFAGGGDESDENESTMAGMTLRILGGYLRPYVFFTGSAQLMSHVWSGTASEPTTAFNGNLLLIDHQEAYPLVSGFVAEQEMRGALSIDVTGKISISLWNKNSHSVVRTKAAVIVQASQSIFTSYDQLWQSHLFSFGGQALIDFVADSDFASSPFKICLQVTQPAFMIRHNSRRRDQTMSDQVRRKITRRNFSIGAKSYSLNTENNKMCSLMSDEL